MPEILLADEAATEALGAAIAALLRPGDVVALTGDLGAGKTTLARGLIRALAGEATEVQSPTYTLVHPYETEAGTLFHLDLYRLERPEDVFDLGWDEMYDGVMLVEWPERAGPHLPPSRLEVRLDVSTVPRRAELCPIGEAWQERLKALEPAR